TVKGIPTSFVKSNMKFPSDGGSGEARLFVGNKSKFQELNAFFGLDDSDEKHKKITAYTVMFDKNNFLDYMKYVQLEHVFQLFNKYNDASLEEWQKSYNGIKELKDDDFIVNLYTVNDKNRYYVRADEKIFKDYLRSVIVPKISDIIFLKDEVKKIIEIRLSVNYSYTSSPNGEEEQDDSKIDLPTSPKSCAEYIINHIYDLDSFQCLKPVFKVNDTTIRVEAEILQNLGLPRKSLRFFFNLPTSASYTKSDNDNKVRVFDKVYDVPTEQGNYHAKLTTEWQDKPLEDDFDGNSLTALIKVVNEYYSHYLEIVKTENGYCLKIKNKTTKGIIPSTNILLYGVPGCGKSFYVEKNYESKVQEGFTIRVVFHPDYTYSDFVGQLMPVLKEVKNAQDVKEEKLQYDFVPGPFTRILQLAEIHKDQQCLLIIEELNRGNAPAIFGEIFQLLDRNDDGTSKYAIYNREISKELYDNEQQEKPNEPIKLPPNLTIVATMNTSDQNVFTMDTAFQRRWQMKHIPNRFTGESLDEKTINHVAKHLPNSEISWGVFAQTINKKMHTANLGFGGTEDKSLGVYFATDNDLDDAERFAEKVLKYLWDDAFKLGRKELFNDCSQGLSAVIEAYEDAKGDPLKAVLVPEVYNEMQKKMAEMAAEQAQTAEEKTSEEEAAKSAAEDNPAQEPAGEE
ncbi:AAA family ATPase, partial [Phascolarctobacterium succinatutens]|uniref:AAA family ATPase n=2 Tax=Phascolarctobacterium succinatutens TaxID=626940 RepID=UPI003FD85855